MAPAFQRNTSPKKGKHSQSLKQTETDTETESEHDTPPAQSHPSLEILDHNSMFTIKPHTIDEVNSLRITKDSAPPPMFATGPVGHGRETYENKSIIRTQASAVCHSV